MQSAKRKYRIRSINMRQCVMGGGGLDMWNIHVGRCKFREVFAHAQRIISLNILKQFANNTKLEVAHHGVINCNSVCMAIHLWRGEKI